MKKLFVIILFSLLLFSCSNPQRDTRLVRISKLASSSDSAHEALDSLNKIDYSVLSDKDKHYYDFLSVKAADKAYVVHTSDSLALCTVDYATVHPDEIPVAEALYYAGRVYFDLGDYKSAISFFIRSKEALENVSVDSVHTKIKINALSQTGRLYNRLRLYNEAIRYLHEAIETEKIASDSLSLMYDMQLLGCVHLHTNNYDLAEKEFKKARSLAERVSEDDIWTQEMYLAAVKLQKEKTDSALLLIRPVVDRICPLARNEALAYAASIYLKENIPDTAYMYAKQLLSSNNSLNVETAYQILLSPELSDLVSTDNLRKYAGEYHDILVNYLNKNEMQDAIFQKNIMNYESHYNGRIKAEKHSADLGKWLTGSVFAIIISISIALYFKYKNSQKQVLLLKALERINSLEKKDLSDLYDSPNEVEKDHLPLGFQESRDNLRKEFMKLQEKYRKSADLPEDISCSDVYHDILSHIKNGSPIPNNSSIWNELDRVVNKESAKFNQHIYVLSSEPLNDEDLHMLLLLKCQIKPTHLSILLSISKPAICARRNKLTTKLFDQKIDLKAFDQIVTYL